MFDLKAWCLSVVCWRVSNSRLSGRGGEVCFIVFASFLECKYPQPWLISSYLLDLTKHGVGKKYIKSTLAGISRLQHTTAYFVCYIVIKHILEPGANLYHPQFSDKVPSLSTLHVPPAFIFGGGLLGTLRQSTYPGQTLP